MFRIPGFALFWSAETISQFGTYVTTIALQVLIVVTLHGSATDVGLVNSARWLPYLLLGLIVGALVERRRRRPLLVVTDLGRGVLLGLIPLLILLGMLNLPALMVIVAAVGVLSLVNDASSQSYVPRLVPRRSLLPANARLDQSLTAAQTMGPAVGGLLVGWLTAPVAILVDSVSYFASAVLQARIRVVEPKPGVPDARRSLRREIAEGLRWTYRHRTLAPAALWGHAWFLVNSLLTTAYVAFVLIGLELTPFQFGLTLAAAGVGGFAGTFLAGPLGRRWGAGPTVIAAHALLPFAWAIIAAAAMVPGLTTWSQVIVLIVGQALYGLSLGTENANEMGYRQAIIPDELQGRVNTTIRSINRAMIVIGAPLGGVLADGIGYLPTLWVGAAGFAVVAIGLALSPFRSARHDDDSPDPEVGAG